MSDAKLYLEPYGKKAKTAVVSLANSPESQRNDALKYLAEIIDNNKEEIYRVNKLDVDYATQKGLSSSMVDRLVLNEKRIFDRFDAAKRGLPGRKNVYLWRKEYALIAKITLI